MAPEEEELSSSLEQTDCACAEGTDSSKPSSPVYLVVCRSCGYCWLLAAAAVSVAVAAAVPAAVAVAVALSAATAAVAAAAVPATVDVAVAAAVAAAAAAPANVPATVAAAVAAAVADSPTSGDPAVGDAVDLRGHAPHEGQLGQVLLPPEQRLQGRS